MITIESILTKKKHKVETSVEEEAFLKTWIETFIAKNDKKEIETLIDIFIFAKDDLLAVL